MCFNYSTVADGQEEILAHHENMVNAVENGELKFKPEGADKYTTVVVGTALPR